MSNSVPSRATKSLITASSAISIACSVHASDESERINWAVAKSVLLSFSNCSAPAKPSLSLSSSFRVKRVVRGTNTACPLTSSFCSS